MGCPSARGCLRGERDRFALGCAQLRVAEFVPGYRRSVVRGQELQDLVATLEDLGIGRDDEGAGGRRARLAFRWRLGALLDRIANEVVVGRRLGQAGQDRGLARSQLAQRLAEVRAGRGLDPVAQVAVAVLVQVGGDDLALARLALELLGHPDGLNDFLELALEGAVGVLDEARVEQPGAHELLGDGGRATAVDHVEIKVRRDEEGRPGIHHALCGSDRRDRSGADSHGSVLSAITLNWRGKPLVSHEVIVKLIAATTTRTGLRVRRALHENRYPAGRTVSDADMNTLHLRPDAFHGEWNYTLISRLMFPKE